MERLKYSDRIVTLDFETTSIVKYENNFIPFDIEKAQELLQYDVRYSDFITPYGFVYLWGITIDGEFHHGRNLFELYDFLYTKIYNEEERTIIWVHNLSFEFQFLRNIIKDFEIFARKSRQLIYCTSEELNIEFRCSYLLTNLSLLKCSEQYCPELLKKVGDLDYSLIRHEKTKITKKELNYLKTDCLIIHFVIKKHLEEYKHFSKKFPFTSTGKLRLELKKRYQYYDKLKIGKCVNTDLEIFKKLVKAFSGGYTHANAIYTGRIMENVQSYDIVSSYPTDMLLEKYPMTPFQKIDKVDVKDINNGKKAHILTVKYTDIKAKGYNNFISHSKINKEKSGKCVLDNGRIERADFLEITVTNVDFLIIKQNYTYKKVEFIEVYESKLDYLPKILCNFIVELFEKKQTLKGVLGKEEEYMKSKNLLNSLYGMLVTNVVRDEVVFLNQEWGINPISEDVAKDKLHELAEPFKLCGSYAWGVWVTAYARRKLWYLIRQIDEDIIYCDTDSIKFIGDYTEIIENYNKKIAEKRFNCSCRLDVDYTILGNIGEFEIDGTYDKFVTLGAKKYCYENNGKIAITVSGVAKKASKHIHKIEDFKEGFIFDYETSYKNERYYNDMQEDFTCIDYQGVSCEVTQQFGISLIPTTYTLDTTCEYQQFIKTARTQIRATRCSVLDDDNILFNLLLMG